MSGFLDIGPLQSGSGLDIGPLQSAGGTPQTITGSTGIPSAEAFGSGGFLGDIVGTTGIPSAEAFGTTGIITVGDALILVGSTGIPSAEVVGSLGALAIAPNLTGDAGIPSAEAFGSGGSVSVQPGIVGNYGIVSGETFGQGAVILASTRPVSIFLSNADVTDLTLVNTLNITDPLSGPSTAAAQLHDKTGALHPQVGQEFLVYRNGLRIFGGQIDEVTESVFQALPDVVQDLRLNDFSQILDKRVIGVYLTELLGGSLQETVAYLVNNFLAADGIVYDSSDGNPEINLGPQLFNWITAREAFTQLAQKTNWDFRIDPYKTLRFFPRNAGLASAPFDIVDNGGKVLVDNQGISTLKTRQYRGKYRNRQFVLSSTQSTSLWCDTFSVAQPGPFPSNPQPPDGIRRDFITLYPINKTPLVNLNTNGQRVVSLLDITSIPSSSWDWYWIPPQGFTSGGNGVFQNPNNAVLTAADTLVVCYESQLPPVTFVENASQIAARAAVEGNSGAYDDVAQGQDITDPLAIAAYAEGLLERFGAIPRENTYTTTPNQDGLKPGQLQLVNTTKPLIPSALYLITQVVTREIDKTYMRYDVVNTTGANPGDWTQFFATIARRGKMTIPSNRELANFPIAPSYSGIANPGAYGGIQPQPYIIQNTSGLLQYVTVFFTTPPSGADIIFDILVNSSGALGQRHYPAGTSTPLTYYFQSSSRVIAGDVLRVYLLQVGSVQPGKDGLFTIVISITA